MPRLPRTPLYEVQNPQNNTRVTPIQRVSGEDAVGEALGKQGEAAFEIGSRLREAQITNEVAKAHNDLNLKLDAEYRQLEKDTGDPLELEAKWQERSKAILAETSGGMTSPMHRRLFDAQAAQLAEGYQIKTRDLTRKKQVQGAVADTYRMMDELAETAADPDIDIDVLQRNVDNTVSLAREKFRLGILNEEQLAEIETQSEDQLQLGKSVRNVATINRLLDNGYIDEARSRMQSQKNDKGEEQNTFRSDILPEQREKLDDVLKVKAQAADEFATADQLVADARDEKGNVDWEQAIAAAYDIKNPELREGVENRITRMREQQKAARDAKQSDLSDAGLEVLLTGRDVSAIPADVYAEADAGTKQFWNDYVYQQRQRAKTMDTLSEQEKAALKQMSAIGKDSLKAYASLDPESYTAGPVTWTGDMKAQWDNLLPEHQSEIMADVAKRRERGSSMDAADDVFKQLISQVPMLGPSNMKGEDFSKGSGGTRSNRTFTDEENAVRASLLRQAQQQAARTGGAPLTTQETKLMIARAFHEANAQRYPEPRFGQFAGQMTGAIRSASGYSAYDEARSFLQEKLGREPTREEIAQALSDLEAERDQ